MIQRMSKMIFSNGNFQLQEIAIILEERLKSPNIISLRFIKKSLINVIRLIKDQKARFLS